MAEKKPKPEPAGGRGLIFKDQDRKMLNCIHEDVCALGEHQRCIHEDVKRLDCKVDCVLTFLNAILQLLKVEQENPELAAELAKLKAKTAELKEAITQPPPAA